MQQKEQSKYVKSQEISALFIVLIVLSVINMILFVSGQWYFSEKLKEQQNILSQLQDKNADIVNRLVDPSRTKTASSTPISNAVDESAMKTYKNTAVGYQVEYLTAATLEESDTSCVTIEYKQGYVTIAQKDKTSDCLRTVTGTKTSTTEKVTVDGKEYTATGSIKKGSDDKLSSHNETLVITLSNGNKIEYGSLLDSSSTFEDYSDIRSDILDIVKSYKKI